MVVSISVAGSFSDRRETRTAHQRSVVFIRIASNHKVGFIIKSAVALAAKPESVLIPFRSKRRNLLTVRGFVTANGDKLGSQGPVVRSSSSSSRSLVHRSSHVSGLALHPTLIRKSISIFSHPVYIHQIIRNMDMSHVINWKRILFGNRIRYRIRFESDIESDLTCDGHMIDM